MKILPEPLNFMFTAIESIICPLTPIIQMAPLVEVITVPDVTMKLEPGMGY
jgi:hypothetical protein